MGIVNFIKNRKSSKKQLPSKGKNTFLKPKVIAGLALGGGGARGFAHIGVIRAFEECNIEFPIVTGTSIGSLVGSLYSYGLTSNQMFELAKDLNTKEIRSSKLFFKPSPSKNIEDLLIRMYGDITFDDLRKKFAAVAVDIKTGEEVVLREGKLAKAVSASCAVPIIFSSVQWGEHKLVDGGLSNVIPADIARELGAEVVISIDINSTRGEGTDSNSLIDTFFAVFRISMKATAYKCLVNSDIIVKPQLKNFKSTSFFGADEMIEEGYRATMEAMPQIKAILGL